MEVKVISSTQQEFNGTTYYLCGNYFQNNGNRLHRRVYEAHHGEIPSGKHVHHVDGNRSNNHIDNLLLMDGAEHLSEHMNTPERLAHSKRAIEIARKYASEWHGSKEGKAWHSEHAKEVWEGRTTLTYTCTNCGKQFETRHIYTDDMNRFCCNNCKSAYRRKQGYDNEERECAGCGKTFIVSKYSTVRTCSRVCGWRVRKGEGI